MATTTERLGNQSTARAAFVGRQPILGPNLDVFGYELLFRAGEQNSADIKDGDFATASVLLNSFTDVGLDMVTGSKRAFFNLTRNLLLNADLSCLPPEHVVLEVLEDIEADEAVLAAIRRLKADGYTFALDDFIYCHQLRPLIELADIVKIEFPQTPREQLAEHVAVLRELGVRKILAEKLETHEEFELCKRLGCDLFQGYFFSRPQVLSQRRTHCDIGSVVRLVGKLQDPDVTTAEIEEVIRTDANLSYKVMRFVNSANAATECAIDSLRHATALLGTRRLRSLASMMMLASVDEDKPRELIQIAMTRAKMCEVLAETAQREGPDRYYTLGLLSVMDAMLDLPMEEIVRLLPLSNDMNEALVGRRGPLGETLGSVLDFEAGREGVMERTELAAAYIKALQWTAKFGQGMD